MSNEKKPKKKSAAPSKEHRQPWQEKYASPEEIQRMLSERVLLRYNDVRHRTELHWLSQPFDHDAIFAQAYALYRQGFEYRRKSAQRGYIAVHRTGVEMEQYRRFLAEERTVTDDGMTAVW